MNIVLNSSERALLSLTRDELVAINNALNEVCNGVHISDRDFQTRLGVDRSFVATLLEEISAAFDPGRGESEVAATWSGGGGVMVKAITVFGDPIELGESDARMFSEDLARARKEAS